MLDNLPTVPINLIQNVPNQTGLERNENIGTNHPNQSINNDSKEENTDTNPESSHMNIYYEENKDKKKKSSKRKYHSDCLRRKLKKCVLKYSFELIKGKIRTKYTDLKKIGYAQTRKINISFEKKFIYKTLGDIFSAKITTRFKTIGDKKNFNKDRIDKLKLTNPELKNIFDVTFIQCLNHFMEYDEIDALKGMKTFEQVKAKENIDEMEEKNLKFLTANYEKTILNSRARKKSEDDLDDDI
jgi:hypothetical protein